MRHAVLPDFAEITKTEPEKKLLVCHRRKGGRNNKGRLTVRHLGGGHRHHYRIVDFREDKLLAGKVIAIEYDPNRSARLALIQYPDGERRYVLATTGMSVSGQVASTPFAKGEYASGIEATAAEGNRIPLRTIPEGSNVCCLDLNPGRGAQIVRSAGATAVLMSKTDKYAQVKLPSGEIRFFLLDCRAKVGTISNAEHRYESLGKAGRNRWRGRRPKVRGVVMNPIDHPLGGGEGKSSGGRPPVSSQGKPEGVKTRNRKRFSQKLIVKCRK